MNTFDSYMLNKVRRLKDVRTRYAATARRSCSCEGPQRAGRPLPPEWRARRHLPPEFERILNGESASMLAQDARLGKL